MSDDPYMDFIRREQTRPRYAFGVANPIIEIEREDPEGKHKLSEEQHKFNKETDVSGTDCEGN